MLNFILTIFEAKIFIVAVVFIASAFALIFSKKFLYARSKKAYIHIIISSAINSFLTFVIFDKIAYRYVYFFMIFFTILVNMELALITKDSLVSRIYVFFITLCDYSLLFVFSISLVTLWFSSSRETCLEQTSAVLSTISLMTIFFTSIVLLFGKNVIRLIKDMVHSISEGMLLLYYSVVVSIIVCSTCFFIFPYLVSETTHRFQVVYYQVISFISLLLFTCSFFLLYIQVKLEQALLHEKNLSVHIKSNSMLNYRFNANTGILEKNDYFKSSLFKEGNDYYEMMRRFIKKCVHPDDQVPLLAITRKNFGWDRLATVNGNSFEMRCRILPSVVVWLIDLPKDKIRTLGESKKEWVWINITTVVTKNEMIRNTIVDVFFENIDDTVTYENSLREAASTDMLTGILNRGALEFNIREYLKKADSQGALFMFDLDHFKEINDTFGHGKGDEILKKTAEILKSIFRYDDIIGRLGGDEFVVFCKGNAETKILLRKARRLLESVRFENQMPDGSIVVTSTSIGIAISPMHGTDFETLYHNADLALYKVKNSGRNGIEIYS